MTIQVWDGNTGSSSLHSTHYTIIVTHTHSHTHTHTHSPYDTMEEVIGLRGTPGHGSLMEWGVSYRELALAAGGQIDWEALATAIVPGEAPCVCVCERERERE